MSTARHHPVIGVSCYVESVDRSPWHAQRSAVLPHRYVEQLERAGAVVVVLPPRPDADDELAGAVLERLDGLVIAGGADVQADRYDAEPHPTSQPPRPDRDEWELALARVSAARDLPVLGICRGMQVMAVESGGRLIQDLPDAGFGQTHREKPGAFTEHGATFAAGSLISRLLASTKVSVNSSHHQAVADPGSLTVTGHADDGTVEVLEDPDAAFVLGVQWHPEMSEDRRLFEALVHAAHRRTIAHA